MLLNFLKNYLYFCVCVHTLWMYALWSQKRESDFFVLELQAVVSILMWILGIEPQSSRRAEHALNH